MQSMGPGVAMMHPIVAHDSLHPVTVTYTLQQDLLQESDAEERRWLLALELHSYFIRKFLKNPLSPARRSNFHRKVVLWQRLLSSDLAAERSSARRCAALPRERPWAENRACRENSYRYRLGPEHSVHGATCRRSRCRAFYHC